MNRYICMSHDFIEVLTEMVSVKALFQNKTNAYGGTLNFSFGICWATKMFKRFLIKL